MAGNASVKRDSEVSLSAGVGLIGLFVLIAATTTTAAVAAAVDTGTAIITTAATGTARPRRTIAAGAMTASAPTRRVSPTTRASHRPPPLHACYLRTVTGNALHSL